MNGANPKTCLHNVVECYILKNFELSIVCVSCRTDLTNLEKRIGKNYEYDIDNNVWVHCKKKECADAKKKMAEKANAIFSAITNEDVITQNQEDVMIVGNFLKSDSKRHPKSKEE